MIETLSAAVLPVILLCAALPMLSRRRDYFSVFTEGAAEGLRTAVRLLPAMTALTAALSMFEASGAAGLLTEILAVPAGILGIPPEILPLAVTRPLSGSASTAAYAELLRTCGADSLPAFCASVLLGSSDTLVYIVSVYFSGAPGVRRTGYAIPIAAVTALFGLFLSCAVGRAWYT